MRVKEIEAILICKQWFVFITLVISLLFTKSVFSQSYGLGFNGQESLKDIRTGLDLSPDQFFSFDEEFVLSFKMLLRPNEKMYFGYICRIIDKNGKNIDLILNYHNIDTSSIEVVCGQKLTKISFNADVRKLCLRWTEFRLKVGLRNNKVILSSPTNDFQEEDIGSNLTGDVKILFGTSNFSHFKTSDLPSMKIKDISINEKGKLVYLWLLDEISGEIAYDQIRKKKASIKNPVWLKPEHSNWQKIHTATLTGNCEIAFNEQEENLYLIGEDQMIIYSVKSNKKETVIYKEKAKGLLPGRQAFYNPDTRSIFSCDIDQKTVSEFDFKTLNWKQEAPQKSLGTIFLHHNQYYFSTEKSSYVFGGYGQHEYKNLIQKIDFNTRNWEIVKPVGDIFSPRYLASAGVLNDTVFLLGGFGSESGKQILNPQNYYDLHAFSLNDRSFRKMYDFVPPSEDICFSNSMVLDPEDRSFYALSFSVIKYDGFLQLVKGSLQKPDIQLIASKIPYSFHDVNSFSSLYFCKSSKKLIAATMLVNNQNQTEFNLYSISFPPNELLEGQNSTKNISSKWIYISGLIIILVFSLFIRKYLSKRKKSNIYIAGNLKVEVEPNMKIDETDLIEKETFKNSIFFFGGFQVFNSKGSDITNRFSPLLKELFLLIWLNSIKIDKGISSEKLTELLWFDKDEKSANNNRAVNIAKLKQILSEIDSCTLSHKTTYWKIDFAETIVYNDYFECLRIIRSKKLLTKEKVYLIIDLSRKGGFLLNLNYEWLDDFKSNISNAIIDVLSEFALKQKIEDDPDFILHLADSMFNFDIVNEDAMMLKCKALTFLGKHSLAANTYSKFAKDYKILYDQHYRIPFTEIVT